MVINLVKQNFTKVTSFANNERNDGPRKRKFHFLQWIIQSLVLLNVPFIPVILDKKILAIKRKLRLDDNHGSLDVGEKKTSSDLQLDIANHVFVKKKCKRV